MPALMGRMDYDRLIAGVAQAVEVIAVAVLVFGALLAGAFAGRGESREAQVALEAARVPDVVGPFRGQCRVERNFAAAHLAIENNRAVFIY